MLIINGLGYFFNNEKNKIIKLASSIKSVVIQVAVKTM